MGCVNTKLNIVLDLDETLVHGKMIHDIKRFEELKKRKNVLYALEDPMMVVFFRPHIVDFIKVVQAHYNIYIYTNGHKIHYDNVVKNLRDKVNFNISDCVYKEFFFEDMPLKNLKKLGLSQNNTIIVDDNLHTWCDVDKYNIVNIPMFVVNIKDEDEYHLNDNYLNILATQLIKTRRTKNVIESVRMINNKILSIHKVQYIFDVLEKISAPIAQKKYLEVEESNNSQKKSRMKRKWCVLF
jgi:hypothetical protein